MKAPVGAPLRQRLEELYRLERSGMRLGLEGIERLLERGGRPDRAFASVLIAGTNGKGSTAAHLGAILMAAGVRTGLYTSPHLLRFNERIRTDGRAIPDDTLETLLGEWWPRFEAERPTFFEAATAIGFDHFSRSGVEVAVVEVGLGGRLDATNVLTPLVSVITTISSDHTEILGDSLRRIAVEKAGIVKERGTLVSGVRGRAARGAIESIVAQRGARMLRIGQALRYATRGVSRHGTEIWLRGPSYEGMVRSPLLGAHQARNAALAALAAEVALAARGLPRERIADAITRGIQATRWPARAELLDRDPPVLLDAAHNLEGATALRETVAGVFPDRPVAFVVGLSRDKARGPYLTELGRVASRFYLTQFAGERSTPAALLLEAAPGRHLACEAHARPADALEAALRWAQEARGVVVVTGSFYLLAEAMPLLGADVPDAL
jgi:dihydrofolate synthase/folylpolyglutamate synthase